MRHNSLIPTVLVLLGLGGFATTAHSQQASYSSTYGSNPPVYTAPVNRDGQITHYDQMQLGAYLELLKVVNDPKYDLSNDERIEIMDQFLLENPPMISTKDVYRDGTLTSADRNVLKSVTSAP